MIKLQHQSCVQAAQLLRASPTTVRIILERYKGAGAQLDEKGMSIEQDILKSSVCSTLFILNSTIDRPRIQPTSDKRI